MRSPHGAITGNLYTSMPGFGILVVEFLITASLILPSSASRVMVVDFVAGLHQLWIDARATPRCVYLRLQSGITMWISNRCGQKGHV